MAVKFTLKKTERLKSKKLIERLYAEGKFIKAYPLRMVYLQTEHTSSFPAQVGVSVPKRNFKLAVNRNRIKRQLRENYRQQKYIVYDVVDKPYIFMISYIAKEEMPSSKIKEKMEQLLTSFVHEIKVKENEK